MPVRKRVGEVLEALHSETDSYGSPSDSPIVKRFVRTPTTATYEDYIYVGRIPLANFYAHAASVFDKKALWRQVRELTGQPKLPAPPKLDVTSLVSELGVWVDANCDD